MSTPAYIQRLIDGPAPLPQELPFPDAPRDDVIPGPRISARYGSYATEIWVSKRMWRRTDGLPEHRFHYQNRWRRMDDYTDIDNVIGKLVSVRNAWNPPYRGVAGETDEGYVSIDGRDTFLTAAHLDVLPSDTHLSRFEQAIAEAGKS
jgi:hypothetical protein